MSTAYSTLLGLALPVTSELAGTWGDVVNNYITNYLDSAVAGTQTLSTDADVTLTKTTGTSLGATSSQYAILNCTGARTALRTITAPAASKIYIVINATTGGYSVKLVGAGPTTGLTIPNGASATVAWNGSDFVEIGGGTIGNLTVNGNLTVTGTSTLTGAVTLSAGTANGVLYLNGSKVATSGSALTWDGTTLGVTGAINLSNNLNFTSTVQRITGDMSNATASNRLAFQTSVTNGNSILNILPNGTGTATLIAAFNNSDPTNGSFTGLFTSASESRLQAARLGTGTYLPLTFFTNGSEQMRLDTSGNLGLQVTPNAWSTTNSVFENPSGSIYTFSGTNQIGLNSNAYYNGTNWIYRNASSVGASDFFQQNGFFVWRNAAAGTSGNTISFSELMRLNSTGLGIGTTPGAKLDVRSAIGTSVDATPQNILAIDTTAYAAGNGGGISFGYVYSSGGLTINRAAVIKGIKENATDGNYAAALVFATTANSASTTERMRLDSSGNLGLGVTPSAWGSNFRALELQYTSGASVVAGQYPVIAANTYNDNTNWLYKTTAAASYYSQVTGQHRWYNAPSGTAGAAITFTQVMTLDSSGNLGLGVTPVGWQTDFKALQISTYGTFYGRVANNEVGILQNIYRDSVGTFRFLQNGYGASYSMLNGGGHAWYNWGNNVSGGAGAAATGTQAMTLDASGNLGIGTTSPQRALHVNGSTGAFRLQGTSVGGYIEIVGPSNTNYIGTPAAISSGSTTDLSFWVSSAERARIDSSGNLLVGTASTTSGARLDVKGVDSTSSNYCMFFENSSAALLLAVQNDGRWRSGTAAASPYNYTVGATNRDLFVDNAGEIGYVSSVRASKTNIAPVSNVDWLLRLNPVTFNFRKKDTEGNYTEEADGPLKHGLIAEEVEAVNPDLCFYDDADQGGALRGVNYTHLITPMLKLIQEQQAVITDLRARVAQLESK